MTTTTIPATPTKLQSGAWGAKVKTPVEVGDIVEITTRGGKSWQARIGEVVWTGSDKYGSGQVSICATTSLDQSTRTEAPRSSSRGKCCVQLGIACAGCHADIWGGACDRGHCPLHDG